MKQMIQIRCKNNKKTLNVPIGSTLSEVFRELNLKMDYGPISVKVNNKVEGLHYRLYHNKDLEYLDITSPSGARAYKRTLFFVLCKAVHDLWPGADVVIDIPVSNGYYCNIDIGRPVNQFDAEAVRGRMRRIIDAAMPIRRHESTTEEVIFDGSGSKRNRSPADASGRVTERTHITKRMMKRSGIITFDARSIPFCTPETITKWVSPTNTPIQKTGRQGSAEKAWKPAV